MNIKKLILCGLVVVFTGCGDVNLNISEKEMAVLDSLSKGCGCDFSYGYEKDFLKFGKQYQFNITIENSKLTDKDSMSYQAEKIASAYLGVITNKDKIDKLVVIFSEQVESTKYTMKYNFKVR